MTQTKKLRRHKPAELSGKPILSDPMDKVGLPLALGMTLLEIFAFAYAMGWF